MTCLILGVFVLMVILASVMNTSTKILKDSSKDSKDKPSKKVLKDSDGFIPIQSINSNLGEFKIHNQKPAKPLDRKDFDCAKTVEIVDPFPPNADQIRILDDEGVFEGDIILRNKSEQLTMRDQSVENEDDNLWPDGIVFYEISNSFDTKTRCMIARAMLEFERRTCVRFAPRKPNNTDYVFIRAGTGCKSSVGRNGGKQELFLGRACIFFGIIVHEMAHVIGFWHEHSRGDRDDYVTVVWENIMPGMEMNFMKHDLEQYQKMGEGYDYGSVMHYRPTSFSKNEILPTIIPHDKDAKIGQRREFSAIDAKKMNNLYKCKKASPPTSPAPSSRKPSFSTPFSFFPSSFFSFPKNSNACRQCALWDMKKLCEKLPQKARHDCRNKCRVCK